MDYYAVVVLLLLLRLRLRRPVEKVSARSDQFFSTRLDCRARSPQSNQATKYKLNQPSNQRGFPHLKIDTGHMVVGGVGSFMTNY